MSELKKCPLIPITELLECIVDNRGKSCPTSDSGFPLIATNCIKNISIYPVFENIRYVTDEVLKNWFRAELRSNDILFVNKGTPGRVCLVPDPVTFCAAQDMIGLRVNPQKVYFKYLFAVLRSSYIQEKISNFHVGITIPHFKKSDMKNLLIPVPSMQLQKKIGDLYCGLSEKIELNNKIISELESMAKTLYDYWFLQFDFPDENGKPYKSSGGKMVYNEELKREIPEGWAVKEITNFCDIVDCLHSKKPNYKYENEECFLLTLENLETGKPVNVSEKYYVSQDDYNEWSSRIEVKHNDFVITNAGRAGDVFRIPKDVKCAIGRNLTAVRPVEINSEYLNGFFKSIYFEEQLLGNLDCGSFFKSFNVKSIKTIKVLLPEKNILKLYKSFSAHVLEKIDLVSRENRDISSLRDFLLPMLMNGQVTFKDAAEAHND